MRYFWIVIIAIFIGIFDSSFLNIGVSDILVGVTVLSIFFVRKKHNNALIFAFIYGLIADLFLRVNVGATSLLMLLFTWLWIEARENIKFNSVINQIVFSTLHLFSMLFILKLRYQNFNFGRALSSIDIIFIAVLFIYAIIFGLIGVYKK
jgi:hypothetical protein